MPAKLDTELEEQLTEYIDRNQWPFHDGLLNLLRKASVRQRISALQMHATKGYTALHRAVLRRHHEFVDLILSCMFDPLALLTTRNQYGQTPLHSAVNSGCTDMVYKLLNSLTSTRQQLALLNVKDNANQTAFDVATLKGDMSMVQAINRYRLREPTDAPMVVEQTHRTGRRIALSQHNPARRRAEQRSTDRDEAFQAAKREFLIALQRERPNTHKNSPEKTQKKNSESASKKEVAVQNSRGSGKTFGVKPQLVTVQRRVDACEADLRPAQRDDISINSTDVNSTDDPEVSNGEVEIEVSTQSCTDLAALLTEAEYTFDKREDAKYISNMDKVPYDTMRKLERRLLCCQANKIDALEDDLQRLTHMIADLVKNNLEKSQQIAELQTRLEILERTQRTFPDATSSY